MGCLFERGSHFFARDNVQYIQYGEELIEYARITMQVPSLKADGITSAGMMNVGIDSVGYSGEPRLRGGE